jgi:hypothetical protein
MRSGDHSSLSLQRESSSYEIKIIAAFLFEDTSEYTDLFLAGIFTHFIYWHSKPLVGALARPGL